MESPLVKIISECFVKPKLISEEEAKKPIYFSPWDLPLFSFNYIQMGLLFRSPENQDFSIATFLEDLIDSVSSTLTHFHPLAARLATVKQQNPPSLIAFLNPENSPGARFIHSTLDLKISDVLEPIDIPSLIVQSFFDHHRAISHDGHRLSLLSIQVTELIDGIFIGCSVNHMVADGTSYWHFFNSWSEVFRSKTQTLVSLPPILERWIPSVSDHIMISLPFTDDDELIDRYSQRPFLRERIFRFSSDSLAKLKAKVNSECNNTNKISTLQGLSAVVWRCVTRARRLPADAETRCRFAVNDRSRIYPPMPENYFGNMVLPAAATATAGELMDHGVGWAAWRLHEAVVNHDDKAIKGFVDSWLKKPFVVKMSEYFDPNGVHMGNSPRYNVYGNEFGLGKGVAVLSGYANKFDGKITLYPGRDGGGSIDLEVCLLPENMAAFETDEELKNVVNGGTTI